jgi:hypothetical protein
VIALEGEGWDERLARQRHPAREGDRVRLPVPGKALAATRVLVYGLFVAAACSASYVRRVSAATEESLGRVGPELLDLGEVLGSGTPVVMNGSTIVAGGRHVRMDLHEALDRAEAGCGQGSMPGPTDLGAYAPGGSSRSMPHRLGVWRHEGDRTGWVLCIVPNHSRGDVGRWIEGVREFAHTGDLAAVGEFRYVFVRRSTLDGTDVAGLRTVGRFDLRNMLLFDGDAPGRDLDGVPRPPGSRRILSAQLLGKSYGINSYDCVRPASTELVRYDDVLSSLGWKRVPLPATGADGTKKREARAFIQKGATIVIAADNDGPNGGARLNIVAMGGEDLAGRSKDTDRESGPSDP